MSIGFFCSVVAIVGLLLNKKVSEYRNDFNSKNSEFARIDSLIDGLEKKLARLPELQKPTERLTDVRKSFEPWETPRDVAVNFASAKKIIQKKSDSSYKFSATENFLKYRIGSTCSENSVAKVKPRVWKTMKYRGHCSCCDKYFEVTLNSDERTALCPECFHKNPLKPAE